MNRLTMKISNANNFCKYELKNAKYRYLFDLTSNKQIEDYVDANLTIAIDKLGKLEDIEEELGCPLEVVFKTLENGVWYKDYKDNDKIKFIDHVEENIRCKEFIVPAKYTTIGLKFKDYGNTWWLSETKEE